MDWCLGMLVQDPFQQMAKEAQAILSTSPLSMVLRSTWNFTVILAFLFCEVDLEHPSGTAVYLYGATNGSYEIVLDNTASSHTPPTSDLLFSTTNLTEGTHSGMTALEI